MITSDTNVQHAHTDILARLIVESRGGERVLSQATIVAALASPDSMTKTFAEIVARQRGIQIVVAK